MTLNFKRIIKFWIIRLKLYKIFPYKTLHYFSYLFDFSKFINETKVKYSSDFYAKSYLYDKRYDTYKCLIENEIKDQTINYLEFGVAGGASTKWWLANHKNINSKFWGFDTFEGLPEDWGNNFQKGHFDQKGNFPVVNDDRCTFVKGIFQKSLRPILPTIDFTKKTILHLDADLYSSTLYVLTTLAPFLKKDDIIIFDEFGGPIDEFKAWIDFVKSYYVEYTILVAQNNFFQLALKVDKI